MTNPLARIPAGPLVVACLTLIVTLLTLDPGGDRLGLPEGPGLTTDEVLNVEAGLSLQADLAANGWGLLLPESWSDAFSAPHYQSDYPPLGRLVLAGAHDVAQAVWPVPTAPADPPRWFAGQARTASAFAFAATILLVGGYTTRWYGRVAGTVAALALPLMPRLFAHAHIASIESILGFIFTLTVLATADLWPRALESTNPIRSWWMPPKRLYLVTGICLGLTLLTKIQGVLFPIPFSLWVIARYGRRGILGVAGVGLVSALVLFVGWPWLWIDPLEHAKDYFLPAGRSHLFCWYLGQRYIDGSDLAFPEFAEVPWHYPFVMFAVTVPVGLHVLGLCGVFVRNNSNESEGTSRRSLPLRDPRLQLILGVMLFPLLLFAIPGITVYDGERLFLVSFPLGGVCVGRGAAALLARLLPLEPRASAPLLTASWKTGLAVVLLLFSESYTLITLHPCQLSYYNWLVGGLRGANALGFEPTYWADSVTREMHQQIVAQVPAGATVHVAPVLHPIQLEGMLSQAPLLIRHGVKLAAYDDSIRDQVRYVLVYRRQADPRDSLNETPEGGPPPGLKRLAEIRRDGIPLAVLYAVLR